MSTEQNDFAHHMILYNEMCGAISTCYNIDQCKYITDRSFVALIYYRQIKDEETRKKFVALKLRAHRQIAIIIGEIDLTGCYNRKERGEKVRATYPSVPLKDQEVADLLLLSKIKNKEFRQVLDEYELTGGIADFLRKFKLFQEKIRVSQLSEKERAAERARAARDKRDYESVREAAAQKQREEKELNEQLLKEMREAYKEAGYTLDRRDRMGITTIILPLRNELHAMLRQAAFDHKMTMSEILREGLRNWLYVHGYEPPDRARKTPGDRPRAK